MELSRPDPPSSLAHPWTTRPWWRQLLGTVLGAAVWALVFTIAGFIAFANGEGAWRNLSGWGQYYLGYLVVSLCIGFAIHGLFFAGFRWFGAARIRAFGRMQRVAFFGGVPLLGIAIGLVAAPWISGGRLTLIQADDNKAVGLLLFSVMVLVVAYQLYALRYRRLDAERRATAARLQLLQGQIEPHFLFNTLANVLSLMESDTPSARRMLESFVDYLRASVGSLRQPGRTLGDELELVEAYLRIVQMRMHDRLRVLIDVPDALRALALPALTLQPLVENAIQHGLEPKVEGGMVQVRARRQGRWLELVVEDDGCGLPPAPTMPTGSSHAPRGTGTALANTRGRLRALYGDAAALELAAALPSGVRCVLRLPAEPAASPTA